MDDQEAFAAFLLRMRGAGIVRKDLIAAFEATPRRAFVPGHWQSAAWSNRMVPIECGEAMEGVDLQARVLAALAIEPGNRILEIGTGSGYTAAVMARIAARVFTVDRFRTLIDQARQRFEALALTNILARQADGANGLPGEGPFDRIVVWSAFESLPRAFVDQLSSGGTMVAPIGPEEGEQVLVRLTKVGSRFEREDIGHARLQRIASGTAVVI